MATGQRIGWGGQLTQKLDPYLKGEATRAIERGSYERANGFISRQIKLAVSIAQNMTNRQFPNAYARDERRRPIPGAAHLNDSWTYSLASARQGASLVNTHPKAKMLLVGFSTPSVIAPKDFLVKRNGAEVPVLIFPRGTNGVAFVPKSQTIQLTQAVVRPVPASQREKSVNETIPYMAIRQAFRQGRRA